MDSCFLVWRIIMETENKESYKAAIYCRLSEEDRFKANENDDSNSIVNQKELLTRYCTDHGWQIYDIYSDDDFTGSDRNRPEFNRMLKDAENHKFNMILCKTQSRFTREIELVEKYINYLLPIWGVRFVSVVDNADTSVKGNKKSRQINGLINEWYLEDMSENIKAVLTNRRKSGYFIGAFAPYGYKKDPDRKGHLIIDEDAARVVRLIYDLYISGMGRTAVARELNARHIPTPTDYKLSHGTRYKNNYTDSHNHLWRYFMVGNILTNETYIGNLVQNKAHSISYKTKIVKPTDKSEWIRVENTHEPIIDRQTWDMAQQILDSKVKPTFESSSNSCGINIFSKKVFCSECGRAVRMSKGGPKNGHRRYLRCSTRYYAPEECVGVNIGYDRLYEMVFTEFKELISKMVDEDKVSSYTTLRDKSQEMLEYYQNEYRKTQTAIDENTQYLKNLYIDKVKGLIDDATYVELSEAFTAEKNDRIKQLSQIKERTEAIRAEMDRSQSKLDLIREYINCNEMTFEMVRIFIEKIVIHPKKPYSREDNVEVFWNF